MEIKPATKKIVKKTTKPQNDQTTSSKYDSMSNSELKKIIEERRIEGKSKLTTKKSMIEVLTFIDRNPHDHKGLTEIISKYGKKKSVPSSEDTEENKGEFKPPTLLVSKVHSNPKESDTFFTEKEDKIEIGPVKILTLSEENNDDEDEENYEEVLLVKKSRDSKEEKKNSKEEKKNSKEEKKNSKEEESVKVKQTTKETKETEVFDEEMREILDLTRLIAKRMKYAARESNDDKKFKKFWLKELKSMKDSIEDCLSIQGVEIDECEGVVWY